VSDITWDTFIHDYYVVDADKTSEKDMDDLSFILEQELRQGIVQSNPGLAEAMEDWDDSESIFGEWYQLSDAQQNTVNINTEDMQSQCEEHLCELFTQDAEITY